MNKLKIGTCAVALLVLVASSTVLGEEDAGLMFDPFDWEILKLIHKVEPGNVVMSPLSIKILLAMLYEGANIDTITWRTLQEVCKFPKNESELRRKYSDTVSHLKKLSPLYELDINSKIYLDSKYNLNPSYSKRIKEFYDAEPENIDFHDAKQAAENINEWVKEKTHGKVPETVTEDDVNNAVLVLLNTLFFKGEWNVPFDRKKTKPGGFYVDSKKVVEADYMTHTGRFGYFEYSALDAKLLKIPYKGENMSMNIILPNSKAGLDKIISTLNAQDLIFKFYFIDYVNVEVILPKFHFQTKTKFDNILKKMGLQKIFDNSASFGRILQVNNDDKKPNQAVFVSGILQKAGIEVNEEGSTAYAATEIELGNKFGAPDYIFNASSPFLFFIEETSSGTILFAGKVVNPLEGVAKPVHPEEQVDSLGNRFGTTTVVPPEAPAMNLNPTNGQTNLHSNKYFQLFDMELLKKLDKRTNGNILVSPISVKQVLAMILEGAEGESAHELSVTLNSLVDRDQIKNIFRDILHQLSDVKSGVQFENANHIFVSNDVKPNKNYKDILEHYYNSGVSTVDFNDPYNTMQTINNWVSKVTHGLIESLVSSDSIKPSTSIILANALYFKGLWEKSFNKESTARSCFYNPSRPKNCYDTYMMDASDTYNYADWRLNDLDVKALEIPYMDNLFSMVILLPNKNAYFSRMIHNLPLIYSELIKKMEKMEVIATIPRFSIDYKEDLARVLEEMEIRDIFSQERANLSRMVEGRNDLFVSNVFHKARIEVNEEGTIAAAATGAVVIPLMGNTKPIFRADHPFVFVIRHVPTGAILFSGRVTEPEYAEPAYVHTPPKPAVYHPEVAEVQQTQSHIHEKHYSPQSDITFTSQSTRRTGQPEHNNVKTPAIVDEASVHKQQQQNVKQPEMAVYPNTQQPYNRQQNTAYVVRQQNQFDYQQQQIRRQQQQQQIRQQQQLNQGDPAFSFTEENFYRGNQAQIQNYDAQ